MSEGFIYFLESGKKRIKIGWATDPERRKRTLQTGNPEPLVLLACIPGTRGDERTLHWHLRSARLDERCEWFDAPSVRAYLAGRGLLSSKPRSAEVC